jgi:hypothetical protein
MERTSPLARAQLCKVLAVPTNNQGVNAKKDIEAGHIMPANTLGPNGPRRIAQSYILASALVFLRSFLIKYHSSIN